MRGIAVTDQQADRWANYTVPSQEELKERLSKLEYRITQESGTEKPYKNDYYQYHKQGKEGIYVDVVSGEPLFSTNNQFSSGTGSAFFYTAPGTGKH
ncbi:MAG: peptide-methionine (R)-S-oxide reductase [Owenweeksia sp.]|nr:peptide-methionine (R)-S-oxide reductase [Owenweeksia sp.]